MQSNLPSHGCFNNRQAFNSPFYFLRDYEENMKSAAKFSNTSRCKPAISNPWRFNRFIAVIFI